MSEKYYIGYPSLDLTKIEHIIHQGLVLEMDDTVTQNVVKSRTYLEDRIKSSDEKIYGINTGFGALHDTHIPVKQQEELQYNLILSHACGMGEEVPKRVVKLMLLLKIQNLTLGFSAVRIETVQRLIEMYNRDVLPVVYEQGSLGASGDLAPLAHLVLPLLGKGTVNYNGKKISGRELNSKLGWSPLKLGAKEGLALLNGTQFMCAYGIHILLNAMKWTTLANKTASLSLDAFDARLEPFDSGVHAIRNHPGQADTARIILENLKGSQLVTRTKKHVQDPYSFRCIPQVHGAIADVLTHAAEIFIREMNAVTDNPTVFSAKDKIISAGNFHGQPLAMQLDFLAIALSELASISERRIYKLISGQRALPPFLVKNPGLNSGFMIVQYTAASIVSQNKQLSTPASVDTIDSSNGQEDHVSMGANAATKALRVMENVKKVISIEWMTACQALEFRRPQKSSPILEEWVDAYRKKVPFVTADMEMHPLMTETLLFLEQQQ